MSQLCNSSKKCTEKPAACAKLLFYDLTDCFFAVLVALAVVVAFKVSVNENFSTLLDFVFFFIFGISGS